MYNRWHALIFLVSSQNRKFHSRNYVSRVELTIGSSIHVYLHGRDTIHSIRVFRDSAWLQIAPSIFVKKLRRSKQFLLIRSTNTHRERHRPKVCRVFNDPTVDTDLSNKIRQINQSVRKIGASYFYRTANAFVYRKADGAIGFVRTVSFYPGKHRA